MKTVYLASPLGFSPEWKFYRDRIKQRLRELGWVVSDPWEGPFRPTIEQASTIADWPARVAAFKAIAAQIGKANENMIRSCDAVLGVLDGPELDSGTVSEIGFGAGIGKRCYGLRTDFRDCGDFEGLPFNLQVLYLDRSERGEPFQENRRRFPVTGHMGPIGLRLNPRGRRSRLQ